MDKDVQRQVKNVLFKVSGDLHKHPMVITHIKEKSKGSYVIVICGGGTQINKAISTAGYKINFSDHGRITATLEERQIARDVLETIQSQMQEDFIRQGINAHVWKPVINVASLIVHINGDIAVQTLYLAFNEIYVYTLADRLEKKKNYFKDWPKVQVIGV